MLRLLLRLLPIAFVAIGCGDDPLPVLIDVQYKLTRDIAGGGIDLPSRDINNINGVDGLSLTCSVSPNGSNQIFSMRAYQGTEFGLEFRNVVFPAGGGPLVGTACQTVILEEDNTYVGQCGAGAPTGDCLTRPSGGTFNCQQPCRVYDIAVTNEADGPTVSLKFYCQGLAFPADNTRVVEVLKPGAEFDGTRAQDFPVTLRAVNCNGLAQEE
jgi:hypothetical protein